MVIRSSKHEHVTLLLHTFSQVLNTLLTSSRFVFLPDIFCSSSDIHLFKNVKSFDPNKIVWTMLFCISSRSYSLEQTPTQHQAHCFHKYFCYITTLLPSSFVLSWLAGSVFWLACLSTFSRNFRKSEMMQPR